MLCNHPSDSILLTKEAVEYCEVLDSNLHHNANDATGLAAVGGFLFGPLGAGAGLFSANAQKFYIQIHFRDDRDCLVEVNREILVALGKAMGYV